MAPALDLSKLKVADAEFVPTRRGRTAEPNPFLDAVMDSYNRETGKSIRVPLSGEVNKSGMDTNVAKVINQIRAAARMQDLGVSVQIAEHSRTLSDVKFLAKERRAYNNGDTDEPDEDETTE